MSMFDTLIVQCPNCNTGIAFQSKAGDCQLLTFIPEDVPANIAGDLSGQSQNCPTCGRSCKIVTKIILFVV